MKVSEFPVKATLIKVQKIYMYYHSGG